MFVCVKCGKEATEGSMKHPYCKECFERVWKNDNIAFGNWLELCHTGVEL